jgi:hypothetical protein
MYESYRNTSPQYTQEDEALVLQRVVEIKYEKIIWKNTEISP